MKIKETAARVREAGIIAIIRGDFPLAQLRTIADALYSGGVSVLEITLNSANALDGISTIQREMGQHLLVGAGTVRTVADVNQAIEAGAQFLVSPNFDLASVARSQQADLLHLPGIFTATEAQAAYAAGCRMVKLFPADAFGPSYLKALRAPLDHIDFAPTGGIDATNIADYVQAGAVAFGVGGSLVKKDGQSPEALTALAREMVTALQEARNL